MRGPISCSTRAVLDRIGGQRSCLIIQTLLGGTHRFGELKAAIEGISPRVLSQTLNSLHWDGPYRTRGQSDDSAARRIYEHRSRMFPRAMG
jgi:DNA-binding HxlR family transcriptional regulator